MTIPFEFRRRKSLGLVAGLVPLLFYVGPALAAEPSLQESFEQVADKLPDGWTYFVREEGALVTHIDRNEAVSGTHSIEITHSGTKDWALTFGKRFGVVPGDIWEISAQVKCRDVQGHASVSVTLWSGRPKPEAWIFAPVQTRGSHDWRELKRRFVIPDSGKSIQVRLNGSGQATAWFDDVKARRVGNVQDLRAELAADAKPVELVNAQLRVRVEPAESQIEITDLRTERTYRLRGSDSALILSAEATASDAATIELLHGATGERFQATLMLSPDEAAWAVEISTAELSMDAHLKFPGPWDTKPGDMLVVPLNEGITYPVDDPTVVPRDRLTAYSGHGLSMPWFGLTDGKAGVMALVETPDDMAAETSRDDRKLLTIKPVWEPSKGSLRYTRRVKYLFFESGGYVAQAKAYRRHVQASGRFLSLREKLEENPEVDRFLGAPDVWHSGVDPVEIATFFNQAGIDRMLFCFHGGDRRGGRAETIAAIRGLGYVVTRYDSYRTAWRTGQPPFAMRHFDDPSWIARNADSSLRQGWMIKTRRGNFPGYEVTSSEQVKEAAATIPPDVAANGYSGRFIDTTTASSLMEDYAPNHPLTRSDDRENKTRLLELVSKDNRLITGTETGQDWAAPVVHYFEGMMSLTGYRVPDSGRDMYAYKEPTPDLLKYQVGTGYRVPLWELVYHDSVVAIWYWGDNSDKQPELWDRRDLWNVLYGTPPLWMINPEKWREHRERWVACYKNVCPIVRKTSYREMLDHRWLTTDRTVQQTTFSDGLIVTVNFGDRPFADEAGREILPGEYHVNE